MDIVFCVLRKVPRPFNLNPCFTPGVTVLFEKPSVDDVNTTSMFSQKFEEEVFPPDVQKNDDPTKTGTSWSKPEDESISRYGTIVFSVEGTNYNIYVTVFIHE